MTDLLTKDYDGPEDALDDIVTILENESLLHLPRDDELEEMWNKSKELRSFYREEYDE